MAITDPEQPQGEAGSALLARAARTLTDEPSVMASALAAYRAQRGWSEEALASWLGLSIMRLHALSLCNRPDVEAAGAADSVAQLAAYIGCVPARLRLLLDTVSRPEPS